VSRAPEPAPGPGKASAGGRLKDWIRRAREGAHEVLERGQRPPLGPADQDSETAEVAQLASPRGIIGRFAALLTARTLRDLVLTAVLLTLAARDAASFGRLAVAMAVGSIVVKVVGCGFDLLLTTRLGRPDARSAEWMAAVAAIKVVILAAVLLVVKVAAELLGHDADLELAMLLSALGMGLSSVVDSFHVIVRLSGLQVLESAIRSLGVLAGGSVALLAVHSAPSATSAALVFPVESAVGLTLVVAALGVGRRLSELIRRCSWSSALHLLTSNLPFALISILAILYDKTPLFALERLRGADVVALFSGCWMVVDWLACAASALLISGVMFPLMARWPADDPDGLDRLAGRAWSWLVRVGLTVGLGIYGLRSLLDLVFPSIQPAQSGLVLILIWTIPAALSTTLFMSLMLATGRQCLLLGLIALTLAANIALNALLVPGQGALGAAWVMTATKLLIALLTAGYAARRTSALGLRAAATAVRFGVLAWGSFLLGRLLVPDQAAAAAVLLGAGLLLWQERARERARRPAAAVSELDP